MTILFNSEVRIEVKPRNATSDPMKFSSSDHANFFQEMTEEESHALLQEMGDTFNKKVVHHSSSVNTSGVFNYTDNGTSIAITGCSVNAAGALEIPATINNKPVTSIVTRAFELCNGLTSITIPASVTRIGDSAFHLCTCLTNITIPDGVNSIEDNAFRYCIKLSSITIPNSVTRIGSSAFHGCKSLTSVHFTGNAPAMGENVFEKTATGFTVYHKEGEAGFTSPTWNGYKAEASDAHH